MAIYSVYLPPTSQNDADLADRTLFVREGFSFAAFGLGPFWLLWNRLWLALAAYILTVLLIALAASSWGLGIPASLLLIALCDYFLGLEAARLKSAMLERRRYRFTDIIAGSKMDEVERRFFTRWRARIAGLPLPVDGG